MPLPNETQQWPPKALDDITPAINAWSAWYDGTPDALREIYQRATAARFAPRDHPAQMRGGVQGAMARFWWGRPVNQMQERVDQLHIPIAADICQASADLLYAEPPTISFGDNTALDAAAQDLLDEDFFSTMSAGAEIGAALGGRFHRVTWDKTLSDQVFASTVDADAAIPEFRWGRLVAVTFWTVVERSNSEVWRHLERHELDLAGMGNVAHGLYVGTSEKLGRRVSLKDHSSTALLDPGTDADGYVLEGRTPGLLVTYIPNQTPQRRHAWRRHPLGRYLGRSDLDGVEPLMDALDETYSSWMRDLRLAKSRIFIPDYMMRPGAPGSGAFFDNDREVYVPIRSAAPEDGDATITLNQFTIRVEQHKATADSLIQQILRTSGYSGQTFGETEDGAAVTATEIKARERRTYLTRDRKVRKEKPALESLIHKMLLTQKSVFGLSVEVERPSVQFGDAIQESPLTLAQTALALDQARAASTKVRVALVHPDWDPEEVEAEAAEIDNANAVEAAPSPFEV